MNTFDVIIGALIGMGVSLVTSLVTHWLESSRNKQTRKWMLEDLQTKEFSDLLKTRINDIEKVLDDLRSMAIRSIENEFELLRIMEDIPAETIAKMGFSPLTSNEVPDDLALLKNKNELKFDAILSKLSVFFEIGKKEVLSTSEIIITTTETLSYVSSLSYDELTNDVTEFIKMVSSRRSLFRKLQSVYFEKEKINIDDEKNDRLKFTANIISTHGKIIRQLDTLRVTGKYEEKRDGKRI